MIQPTLRVLLFLLALSPLIGTAQTVASFESIDASQLPVSGRKLDFDPNGSVGTKQYMEWINVYYQAYDKVTFAPVWTSPQVGITPWKNAQLTSCYNIVGDGVILFDRLASRWVIAARTSTSNNYTYCIAVSNTDDLSSASLAWYAYAIPLNSILGSNAQGNVYFPDWPKLGTWPDAYYLTIDLNDVNLSYREVGVVVCALDRNSMLLGSSTPNPPQCFRQASSPSTAVYLGHSLIPADVEGTTPPPAGRDEYLVSIQNPPLDGVSTTSSTFNLWQFHVDWSNPANSTFTQTSVAVSPYTPGCYNAAAPVQTACVPEPSTAVTHNYIDSVGDRFMPGFSYRNFGSYESFLISHAVQAPTGGQKTSIRWYELRGSKTPSPYRSGNINFDSLYRFMPSIAEDAVGDAAVGYSISNASTHPGIEAAWWKLGSELKPSRVPIFSGSGDEENSSHWGDYTSMTVDPVDGCTFWYVNEYFAANQTGSSINWNTRIANFRAPGC